jgi:hypothetical protein
MSPPLLEPVSAGIIVYLLSEYVVSRLNFCCPCELVQPDERNHEDDVSSTNMTISDTTEIDSVAHTHAHTVHVS